MLSCWNPGTLNPSECLQAYPGSPVHNGATQHSPVLDALSAEASLLHSSTRGGLVWEGGERSGSACLGSNGEGRVRGGMPRQHSTPAALDFAAGRRYSRFPRCGTLDVVIWTLWRGAISPAGSPGVARLTF